MKEDIESKLESPEPTRSAEGQKTALEDETADGKLTEELTPSRIPNPVGECSVVGPGKDPQPSTRPAAALETALEKLNNYKNWCCFASPPRTPIV